MDFQIKFLIAMFWEFKKSKDIDFRLIETLQIVLSRWLIPKNAVPALPAVQCAQSQHDGENSHRAFLVD